MSSRTKFRLYPLVGAAVLMALLVTAACMTSQPPLANALAAADAGDKIKPADAAKARRATPAPRPPRKSRPRTSRAPPRCL